MNCSTCLRMMLAVAVAGSMAWAGATLLTSPIDETVANATASMDVVAPAANDSATAVSTLVAENTVGATIITVTNGSTITGGLRGMRRRAGRLNLGPQNVAALNAMPGGWWFQHSCFIP